MNRESAARTAALPGEAMIERGLADARRGVTSAESLVVQIGAPRLRRLGIEVPLHSADPEGELYALLAKSGDPDSAHSRYNALVRTLVSYERALESVGW